MNKDTMYVAILAVLCALAGVTVGAVITKKASLPLPMTGRPDFAQRAEEHFMSQGPREPGERGGPDLLEMIKTKLNLTPEQQTKVMEIVMRTRQEMDKIGENVRGRIDEIREKSNMLIMEILTPEQQEKFKMLLKELERGPRPPNRNGPPQEQGPMRDEGPRPGEDFSPQR